MCVGRVVYFKKVCVYSLVGPVVVQSLDDTLFLVTYIHRPTQPGMEPRGLGTLHPPYSFLPRPLRLDASLLLSGGLGMRYKVTGGM